MLFSRKATVCEPQAKRDANAEQEDPAEESPSYREGQDQLCDG